MAHFLDERDRVPVVDYRHEDIAVLQLGDAENRFSTGFIGSIDQCLDSVTANASGLITTGIGKFFSNGLTQQSSEPTSTHRLIADFERVLNRILTFPLPTVAAINGHAFGGGALFALAHDYRIMRNDRGFLCFPEVDIDIPFSRGMSALIQSKLPAQTAHAAMTTGRRYDAPTALRVGLVDQTADSNALMEYALSHLVSPVMGKKPETLAAIKKVMYASLSSALLGNASNSMDCASLSHQIESSQ